MSTKEKGTREECPTQNTNDKKNIAQSIDLVELKEQISILDVANKLYPEWKPSKSCLSPFREEKNKSFSVFSDGKSFKDFTTGDGGSVFDFYMLATGCDFQTTIRELASMAGMEQGTKPRSTMPKKSRLKPLKKKPSPYIPEDLRKPSAADMKQISLVRDVKIQAVKYFVDRGLLFVGTHLHEDCFLFVDENQVEARRMDGKLFFNDKKVMSTAGSHKTAFGVKQASWFDCIAIVEGTADLLSALHFAWCEEVENDLGFIAMPGASTNFSSDQLKTLSGKRIRIFPDCEKAGLEAAKRWERDLHSVGCVTDCFRVDGVELLNGGLSNDLGDLTSMTAEAFEDDNDLKHLFSFVHEGGEL